MWPTPSPSGRPAPSSPSAPSRRARPTTSSGARPSACCRHRASSSAAAKAPPAPYKILNPPPETERQAAEPPAAEQPASPTARTEARRQDQAQDDGQHRCRRQAAGNARPADDKPPYQVASAAGAAKRWRRQAAGQKCRVWTASYGGQKALIIRSVIDKVVNYTVLDVNEGAEKREADAFISAYAKDGRHRRRVRQPVAGARQGLRALPGRLGRRRRAWRQAMPIEQIRAGPARWRARGRRRRRAGGLGSKGPPPARDPARAAAQSVPACVTPSRLTRHLLERTRDLDPRFRDIARYYKQHGEASRIRWDYAFYQMLLETNYLSYKTGSGTLGRRRSAGRTTLPASARRAAACRATASRTCRAACWRRCSISSPTPASTWRSRWRRARAKSRTTSSSCRRRCGRPVRFDDLTNRWAKDRNYAKSIEWVAERYR